MDIVKLLHALEFAIRLLLGLSGQRSRVALGMEERLRMSGFPSSPGWNHRVRNTRVRTRFQSIV